MNTFILLITLLAVSLTHADNNLGIEKDISTLNKIKAESIYCDVNYIHQYYSLCVCASAEMVLAYYGKKIDQKDIKRLAEGKNFKDDDKNLYTITLFVELVRGLKKKGINWKTKSYEMNNFNGGLKTIISQIKNKNPVLVDTTLYGANTGHTVVISGYDEKQKKIIITDPNIEAPGIRVLEEIEFKKIWSSKGSCRALVLTNDK
jgi:ABC-type bacteriocin/lantibiotic exporter with double-glycine peptidase domain